MNTNRMLIAGLVGGIVYFLLGFLFYGVLLAKFFAANEGTAQGVMKETPTWWALILGNIFTAMLLSLIFERWASIKTFSTGAQAGALIGGLMGLGFDFTILGTSNISTVSGTIVDVIVLTVMSAIVGGVIGVVLGRSKV